jgi:hypothetical protein
MMIDDWHQTQNDSYYELLQERLSTKPLIWVEQFLKIITNNLEKESLDNSITLNDIGCNVGHFYNGMLHNSIDFDYIGYDISETYLSLAREHFKPALFNYLDISKSSPRIANVSIVSATLEHIINVNQALNNIFKTTNNFVLLRTFVGTSSISDYCLKPGASYPYLIRQFTLEELVRVPGSYGFEWTEFADEATLGKEKFVCNNQSIARKQKILLFKKV